MKRRMALILAACLLAGSFHFAMAEPAEQAQQIQKVQDTVQYLASPDINDNFVDDSIIVTMKNQYSTINGTWTTDDFLPVETVAVTDLRPIPEDQVQEYQAKPEFRTILCLTLANPGKENVLQAIAILNEREDILAAEPNYTMDPCSTEPNDTYYYAQSSLNAIRVDKVWDFTTGSSSLKVAVIDSGIYAHPDIENNLLSGYNYDPNSSGTTDTDGHGTAVAGIIGAEGNNEMGVSGVCWNVSLQPYKIRTVAHSVSALNQAQLNGIQIANLSSSVTLTPDSSAVTSLQQAISDYSGLLICAAGNDSYNLDGKNEYPASLDLDNILVVGACEENGNRAVYTDWGSNYSGTKVDIFAPWSSWSLGNTSNSYVTFAKTSAATPLVTGVAALLKSYKPSLTTAQLKEAILDGAATKNALDGLCVTGGMLDAYGALLQVTGKLKNYYDEVSIQANSNMGFLACRISFNTNKLIRTWADFGPVAEDNRLPLDLEAGRVAFIRNPTSPPLTAGGVLFKAKFSMLATSTLLSSDMTLQAISPSSNPYISMKKYLVGDINNDGSINASDSLLAMQHSIQSITLTADQQKRADVNFDGAINALDSQMINQYGVSVIRTFW